MKRLASIAVLGAAALLLLLPSSLVAQRGASGRAAAAADFGLLDLVDSVRRDLAVSDPQDLVVSALRLLVGFRSAGPSGFRTGAPGFRTFAPAPRSGFATAGHPFPRGPFVPFGPGHHGFNNGFNHFHHNRVFFNNCFGFNCGSPFFFGGGFGFGAGFFGWPFFGSSFYGPPYYPYYPGDYYGGYGYGPPAQQQPVVVTTDNGNTVQLATDVQRLSDEVEDLRNEENRRYNEAREQARSGESLSAREPAAVTVFIFRDGRRIAAQSYAITGSTLWIFDEHAARKFLLADLDATATEHANAVNGVEFHVPDSQIKR